jgi:hypothetical protein
LSVLVKASPRSKTTYHGPLGMINARGLWGGVSTEQSASPLAVSWKKWDHPPRNAAIDDIAKAENDDSTWTAVEPAAISLTVARGDTWYRGGFALSTDQVNSMIQAPRFALPQISRPPRGYQPVKVILYVNGHLLGERTEDASSILHAGTNSVLLEIQSRLGGESGSLALGLWHNSPLSHSTWYFHGGLDDLDETQIIGRVTNWGDFLSHVPWQSTTTNVAGQPTFWRCTFVFPPAAGFRQSIGLITTGLKAGHVWLNGHNLGESPQNYPLYMPECWIKDGANDLVVFDLYGSKPDRLEFSRYEAFAIAKP